MSMTDEQLLVDTSVWFSYADRKDKHHEVVDRFFAEEKGYIYVTTDYIIDETITMTARKAGHLAAVKIGRMLWSGKMAAVIPVIRSLQQEAMELFEKFDDKFFSFTDCTSFAVMNRFSIQKALSFDSDFKKAGFISLPTL